LGIESGMAMGTREQRQRQEELWVATSALARPASHPFYDRLNRLLDDCQFDDFVEGLCERFYAKRLGRPGLTPGIYFRLLMVGYFEGIDSERGMAWRAADSLGIRAFLRIALDEIAPEHTTISWVSRALARRCTSARAKARWQCRSKRFGLE
jgi:transposase